MNEVDKLLIKYNFTTSPIESNTLDSEISTLDKNINNYINKIKSENNSTISKEIELINNILALVNQNILERTNYDKDEIIEDEFIIGKSFTKLKEIEDKLLTQINKKNSEEEKFILSLIKTLGNDRFIELEDELLSDEFLSYLYLQAE